jgi:uncharacterized membrane protein YoaK (UPF0700 family)
MRNTGRRRAAGRGRLARAGRRDEASARPLPEASQLIVARAVQAFGSEVRGSALLAWVAGYVDAAGCLALYGLFTAHVTGTLVAAGSMLSLHPDRTTLERLLLIPIFVAVVVVTTVFARLLRRRGSDVVPALLLLMALALAGFAVVGALLHPGKGRAAGHALLWVGGAGVAAMAVQNMLMRDVLRTFTPTTIMTGNLTQCTIDLVDFLFPTPRGAFKDRRSARREAARRLRRSAPPLLAFLAGVALGGWLTLRYGLASVALPALVMGLTALVVWRRMRRA